MKIDFLRLKCNQHRVKIHDFFGASTTYLCAYVAYFSPSCCQQNRLGYIEGGKCSCCRDLADPPHLLRVKVRQAVYNRNSLHAQYSAGGIQGPVKTALVRFQALTKVDEGGYLNAKVSHVDG